jgi:mannosyltransferase OCH1-like enzyme
MGTWKKILTDYEFILWDFNRFDINSSNWVKQAFNAKKYAFAADYIRLYAVYNHGGVYLDMDVEVVKPFDELLNTELMIAFENDETKGIEAGCFGAEKGLPFIKKCLDYHNRNFVKPIVLPIIMRDILFDNFADKKYHVFPCEYFTAKDFVTGFIKKTENTFAIHHYAGSWLSDKDRLNVTKRWDFYENINNIGLRKLYKIVIKLTLKRIIGEKCWIKFKRIIALFGA